MYLATHTRPDISFSVTFLSRFSQHPRVIHMNAAKRILRYIKGTKTYRLIYTKGDVKLRAYSDASWTDGRSKYRSTSGVIYQLGPNIISWTSKQQENVALSSCDSEISSLVLCIKKGTYIQLLCEEIIDNLNIGIDNPDEMSLHYKIL